MNSVLSSIFPNEHFTDLRLYQYGWEHCEPLHSYGPFVCSHYLFHYTIFGTGMSQPTGSKGITNTYQIRSGEGFMVYLKQVDTYRADKEHPWKYTWVEFSGLRVKEALELAGLTMDNLVYHSSARDLGLELKNEMLCIAQHPEQSLFHLIGHLYLFLDYLTRSCTPYKRLQSGKLQDLYIRETTSFIEQDFQNNTFVEDITAFCNLNCSYFDRIFRDAVGKSPQEFLISYHMTKVAELLKLADLMIGDISNAVDCPNQLHFSRVFRRTHGISPWEWRAENKVIGQ